MSKSIGSEERNRNDLAMNIASFITWFSLLNLSSDVPFESIDDFFNINIKEDEELQGLVKQSLNNSLIKEIFFGREHVFVKLTPELRRLLKEKDISDL